MTTPLQFETEEQIGQAGGYVLSLRYQLEAGEYAIPPHCFRGLSGGEGMEQAMSSRHTEAMRRRWADPGYRKQQAEANRRTGDERRAYFADPVRRALLGQAIRRGRRARQGRKQR